VRKLRSFFRVCQGICRAGHDAGLRSPQTRYLRQPKKEKTWATPKKEHDNANSGRYEKPEGEQKQKAAMKNVCCIKDRRFRRSCAASRLKTKAL